MDVREGRYDIMSLILIRLGKKTIRSRNKLIGMLSTLLSGTLTKDQRKKILEDEYDFKLSKDAERGLARMCNLSEAIAWEKDITIAKLQRMHDQDTKTINQKDEALAQKDEALFRMDEALAQKDDLISKLQAKVEWLQMNQGCVSEQ